MMMTDSPTATRATSGRWLVALEQEHDGVAVALRDYFRRLGLDAVVSTPMNVEVTAEESDDHDLEAYVASWTTVNKIAARLTPMFRHDPVPVSPFQTRLRPRLGDVLTAKGMISENDLAWGVDEARATNELLGVVLLRARLIFEDDLARTLSDQLSIPYVNIGVFGVDARAARLLPATVGAAAAAIPIRWEGETVLVGFADPTDPAALAAVAEHLPTMSIAVAELSEIKLAWRDVAARFNTVALTGGR
jgi:hypothetical protein